MGQLATLLLFLGGNAYILFQLCKYMSRVVDKFENDFNIRFQVCGCDDFKADYYRSIMFYLIATCGMAFVAFVQLVPTIVFCLKARKVAIAPAPK
jgi:hypothetical protein